MAKTQPKGGRRWTGTAWGPRESPTKAMHPSKPQSTIAPAVQIAGGIMAQSLRKNRGLDFNGR